MTNLINIEKSAAYNTLWPPIADALSTYIRRRSAGADGYELTWRLIHVWEATTAVLSGAVTTRLRDLGTEGSGAYLTCREHLHGRTLDPLSKTFKNSQGALDGSANRRLELLLSVDSLDKVESAFLQSVKQFLQSKGVDLRPLVTSWQQICDVPPDASNQNLRVYDVFKHVNTFRNRFAHVPFPYDEVAKVAETLALVTEQLFTIEPFPWQIFSDGRLHSPLHGAIVYRSRKLIGSLPPTETTHQATEPEEPHFLFPGTTTKNDQHEAEMWMSRPFLFVDSMFRPSVLTRLISEANGVWEYTRFLAERNSVVRQERHSYLASLPVPSSVDYPPSPDEQEDEAQEALEKAALDTAPSSPAASNRDQDFERALRDIANEEYEPAIKFFQDLVEKRPDYHIAWLRLGYALREHAMRIRFSEPEAAKLLFDRSIDALTRATQHRSLAWEAQALYERSKSRYHTEDLAQALQDAQAAYAKTKEPKYQSWITYVSQHNN